MDGSKMGVDDDLGSLLASSILWALLASILKYPNYSYIYHWAWSVGSESGTLEALRVRRLALRSSSFRWGKHREVQKAI